MNKADSLIKHLKESGVSYASISILEDAIQQVFVNEVIVRSLAVACELEHTLDSDNISSLELDLNDETLSILDEQGNKLMQEVL